MADHTPTPSEATDIWRRTAPADELVDYYARWTRYPVIQAIFFARVITNLAIEIGHLSEASEIRNWFYYRPADESQQVADASYVLNEAYFDRRSLLFRVHPLDEPTCYAIDAGLRVITPWKEVIPGNVTGEWRQIVTSCLEFVSSLRLPNEWGFSIRRNGRPTVFGTLAAVTAIRNSVIDEAPLTFPVDVDLQLDPVGRGLVDSSLHFGDSHSFAFSRSDGHGCLSTTEHAYRIPRILSDLGVDCTVADDMLHRVAGKVHYFVRECWDAESGGFRSTPSLEAPVNLTHTRYALQLLRTLLSRGHINREDVSWLDLGRVLAYVISCKTGDGFSTVAGGVSSICSLRDALSVHKLALIFALRECGAITPEYTALRGLMLGEVRDAPKTAQNYLDQKRQVGYAYPVSLIRGWQESTPAPQVVGASFSDDSPGLAQAIFPGALPAEDLRQRTVRDYIAVVDLEGNTLVRVFQTPDLAVHSKSTLSVLLRKALELNAEYQSERYDLLFIQGGRSALDAAVSSLRGLHDVQPEELPIEIS